MTSDSYIKRRFERFIEYGAYNNTESYQAKIKQKTINPEELQKSTTVIGTYTIDKETGEEKFIRNKGKSIDSTVKNSK